MAQYAEAAARASCAASLPKVDRLVCFALPGGSNQQGVQGGGHAATLAEAISNHLRMIKRSEPDTVAHTFAAAPNALLFYVGQRHQAIAPCVVYEFDFDRRSNKSYHPSMLID